MTPSSPRDLESEYQAAAARGDWPEVERIAYAIDAAQAATAARLNGPRALLDAALWYVHGGIAVFPCRPDGKRPITPHGLKDATTDPDKVVAWWTAQPQANIGLPTGARFGVIDTDGPQGVRNFGRDDVDDTGLPLLAWSKTPRGFHYYFPADPARGNAAAILPGVDYRGVGGYVIAPPSRTDLGNYRWIDPPSSQMWRVVDGQHL